MKIALDIDGTIYARKESIEFFRIITHLLYPEPEHHIIILTNRKPNSEQEIADELEEYGIQYSQIVITSNKADYIKKYHISILIENEDEYFLELPKEVTVFKIREDGNFDYAEKKWVGSNKTTKMIGE